MQEHYHQPGYSTYNHFGYSGVMNKIKELRKARRWSLAKLAEEMKKATGYNTSAQQIHRLESGSRRLSDVWLVRLSKTLNCSMSEILGENPPEKIDLNFSASDIRGDVIVTGRAGEVIHGKPVDIPLIDMVQAGPFSEAVNPYAKGDAKEWIRDTYKHARAFAVEVVGDSMNLKFPVGSRVLVDPLDITLVDRKFYIISHDGHTTLKLYRANPDRFEPMSSNPDHETFFPTNGMQVIGRAVRILAQDC